MEKERITIYDLEYIRQGIPLETVLADMGIDVRRGMFKMRDERTASAKLYYETNTWSDFGGGESLGGGTIEAVMAREGVSYADAIQVLGARYNAPVISNSEAKNTERKVLSPVQYNRIGLVSNPAYKNILRPDNADSFTGQQVQNIRNQYNIPMNQLFKEDRRTYEALLSSVALPYVKDCYNVYLRSLYLYDTERQSTTTTPTTIRFHEISAQNEYQTYSEMHKAMTMATKGTEIDVSRMAPSYERDLAKIQKISIEIGDFPYSDLKALPGSNRHMDVPESLYRSFTRTMGMGGVSIDAPYSAHQKGGTVTISYKEGDENTFKGIFASLKTMAQPTQEAAPVQERSRSLGEHEY